MKNIYDKYIKISDTEKMFERNFYVRITMSVIAILACVAIMVSTAFALFSNNLTQKFTMKAAEWKVDVIEEKEGDVLWGYICPPRSDEMHEFVLTPSGTATKGYCIIEITDNGGNTKRYYTSSFKNKKTVKIQAVAGCKINFVPKWGTPSDYGHDNVIDGTICHSFTPPPPLETTKKVGDAESEEDETKNDEPGADSKAEADGESLGENEESGEFSDEVAEGLPEESSGSEEAEPESSPDNGGEAESSGESDGGSQESSDDGGSASSDSASSDDGGSPSGGGESAPEGESGE